MNITITNTLRKSNDKIALHSEKQPIPSAEEVMIKDHEQRC